MAITEEQHSELGDMLMAIEQNEGQLKDHERNFVADQKERHEKYGLNMFMSEKQWSWLKSIHDRVAG